MNETYQQGGWECGLWCSRWVERALRELHGEGRSPPTSIGELTKQVNQFIDKLQEARRTAAAAEASAAKKEEASQRLRDLAAEAESQALKRIHEPQHASLEIALEYAKNCKKCLPTRGGRKGRRACMGKWFEQVRLKDTKWGALTRGESFEAVILD